MKKLMIGLAAAGLCSAVFADVTSANVVGYAGNALRSGYAAMGPQFVPVSGETIDLIDIKIVNYEGEQEGDISLQQLDYRGKAVDGSTYYWYDLPGDDLFGWLDGSDNELVRGKVTVKPTAAWWVKGVSTTEMFQSSGQVANAPVDVNLIAGYKLVANPTPVAVNFNDDDEDGKFIAVGNYEGEQEGDINVQRLDYRGKAVDGSTYYWYDLPGDDLYGWLDGKDDPVEGDQLQPSEALWVKGVGTVETISFPAAL